VCIEDNWFHLMLGGEERRRAGKWTGKERGWRQE